MLGIEIDDGRSHHPRDRPDRRRQAPANRQHPPDTNADQPARHRILRRSAHRETKRREAKKRIDQRQHAQGHDNGAGFMRRHVPRAEPRAAGERRVRTGHGIAVEPSGKRIEDQREADEHDYRSENGRIGERPDDQPLDQDPADERGDDGGEESEPIGFAHVHQLPCEIGREHRHFALSEIDQLRRLVDHHERQRHNRIDTPEREARRQLMQELAQPPVAPSLVTEIRAPHRVVRAERL